MCAFAPSVRPNAEVYLPVGSNAVPSPIELPVPHCMQHHLGTEGRRERPVAWAVTRSWAPDCQSGPREIEGLPPVEGAAIHGRWSGLCSQTRPSQGVSGGRHVHQQGGTSKRLYERPSRVAFDVLARGRRAVVPESVSTETAWLVQAPPKFNVGDMLDDIGGRQPGPPQPLLYGLKVLSGHRQPSSEWTEGCR